MKPSWSGATSACFSQGQTTVAVCPADSHSPSDAGMGVGISPVKATLLQLLLDISTGKPAAKEPLMYPHAPKGKLRQGG